MNFTLIRFITDSFWPGSLANSASSPSSGIMLLRLKEAFIAAKNPKGLKSAFKM